MLRASAMTNETEIDIQGINGDGEAAATGIKFGEELMSFAEALAAGESAPLSSSRDALLAKAGAEVLVDASGVAANFQRMVRIADSIGIPVDNMETELGQQIRKELGISSFASAKNTLA
jgi:hypothetical protein